MGKPLKSKQKHKKPEQTATATTPDPSAENAYNTEYVKAEVVDAVEVDAALKFDNPVQFMATVAPELPELHKWQFETLMMMAGYSRPGDYVHRVNPSIERPMMWAMPAANGSGKDQFIIAGFNVWFALKGIQNFAVLTSSSFDQVKGQTEPYIKRLCDATNKHFGKIFTSVEFLHTAKRYGSQVKLFATKEEGRAEGFHPYGRGQMAITVNEAKSVSEPIFEGLERCTGYSYWLEISSPGRKSGHFYESAKSAINFPNELQLGEFYYRRISAYDCPHISAHHIKRFINKYGDGSSQVNSSILALFSDLDSDNIIKESAVANCQSRKIPFIGDDIGIGLDLAAGGDENSVWVRKGNRIVHRYFFTQKDTMVTADVIDRELAPWKHGDYVFNADDGGVGHAIIDNLVSKGWTICRRNNQSPAFDKREFLNLGAEMWHHTKRLIERCDILIPVVPKLIEQLTTRRMRGPETTQGKIALQSKREARLQGLPSPDRADGFVLCFFSYRPEDSTYKPKEQPDAERLMSYAEIDQILRRGRPAPIIPGAFTLLNGKL